MEFTAKKAGEIRDSYKTSFGRVSDELRKAASNGESSVTIKNLSLSKEDEKGLTDAGFVIQGNTISF